MVIERLNFPEKLGGPAVAQRSPLPGEGVKVGEDVVGMTAVKDMADHRMAAVAGGFSPQHPPHRIVNLVELHRLLAQPLGVPAQIGGAVFPGGMGLKNLHGGTPLFLYSGSILPAGPQENLYGQKQTNSVDFFGKIS